MVRVTVEVREGAFTYRVRIIAPSIECALEIAGAGKAGRTVRLLFPSLCGFRHERGCLRRSS